MGLVEGTAHFLAHVVMVIGLLLLLLLLVDARCGDKVCANKGRKVDFCKIVELQTVVLVNGMRKARAEKTKTQTVNSWKGNWRRIGVGCCGKNSSVSASRRLLEATAVKH